MNARLTNRFRFFILGLAAALLLPVYGSWIDVSYPAQQPTHKHVYLGKVDLDHHRTAEPENVVILPDQDAASQVVVLIDLPHVEVTAEKVEKGQLSFGLSDEYLSPENTFLPPPDHPPRI